MRPNSLRKVVLIALCISMASLAFSSPGVEKAVVKKETVVAPVFNLVAASEVTLNVLNYSCDVPAFHLVKSFDVVSLLKPGKETGSPSVPIVSLKNDSCTLSNRITTLTLFSKHLNRYGSTSFTHSWQTKNLKYISRKYSHLSGRVPILI